MAAALAAALYAAVGVAFNARDLIRRQTRGPREATIALDALRQDFEAALPPDSLPEEGESPAAGAVGPFLGTDAGGPDAAADAVEFYAVGRDAVLADAADPYAAGPAAEGVYWVELALRDGPDGPALVRRVDRGLFAAAPVEPPEQVLLTGVRSFNVRHLGPDGWVEEWDSTIAGGLPLAVEITLELAAPAPSGGEESGYRVTQVIPLATADRQALLAAPGGEL